MAFIYTLTNAAVTNTDPAGTDLVSLGDDNIRNFKSAMYERVNSAFVDVNSDPWILKSPAGGSGNVQSVIPTADNLYTLGDAAHRFATIWGTLSTAAQPNITSLGTLTGLTIAAATSPTLTINDITGGNPAINWQISGVSKFYIDVIRASANDVRFLVANFGIAALTITQAGNSTFSGIVSATGGFTGTLNTAAQPNITSLGTLIAQLNTTSALVLNGTGQGTSFQYLSLANTGNQTFLGIESSAGGNLVAGSGVYATVLGNFQARSLQFFTNNAIRQTIDSAGNVVFTGTVTAANFVGPTTIDANNLTGTTLNAGVIHSSLQDLGVLSSIVINGLVNLDRGGVTKAFMEVIPAAGTLINDAAQDDLGIRTNGFAIRFSVNSGTSSAVVISSGGVLSVPAGVTANVTGNLTGTILTAAQGNITSLGTLTGLTVNGSTTSNGLTTQTNVQNMQWSGQTTGHQFWDGNNTGAAFRFGIERSVGGALFTGSSAYATVFGTMNATSLQFGTNVTVRMQIDSTGAVTINQGAEITRGITISGTTAGDQTIKMGSISVVSRDTTTGLLTITNNAGGITIANSTGPQTIAGPWNATGAWTFSSTVNGITTLTATSIFGTLATAAQTNITSVGALGSLTIQSPANTQVALNTTTNATSDVNQILFERGSTIKWRIGTNIDGTNNDALIVYNNVLGNAISGNFATGVISFPLGLSGALTGNVTGNLTGTILTAAQANITSLGTLTSLTVSGAATFGTGKIFNGGSTTVGAAFVTIYTFSTTAGGVFYVFGDDGTNSFIDVVACTGLSLSTTATAIGSVNTRGAPAARLYRVNSVNLLQMSVGSGSYTVKTFPHEIS